MESQRRALGFVRVGIKGLLILLLASGSAGAAIPAAERQALIDLYNETTGAGWTTSTNWKTPPLDVDGFPMPGTECSWYGVICDGAEATVTTIYLYSNNLVGPLPGTLGNLVGLVNLTLSGNGLSGSIPSFATNTTLQELTLGGNQLSGPIPSFATNTALQDLRLGPNQLSGSIPSFATNTALQVVDLSGNQLSGSIPSFATHSALRDLRLGFNQLSGAIPSFATNTALQVVDLGGNQLSGSIPSFATNTALQVVDLGGNQLSGSIPSFATHNALRDLRLWFNQLSGAIPSFATNTALQDLRLGPNQLSGAIPSFATNTALQDLRLGPNQLSGSIPSFATNTALQVVDLGGNQLSGSIPSFATNTALQVVDLSGNQLSGSIPSFATNSALRDLRLGFNQLSGAIPSFATNTALQDLRLGSNQLSGSIPSFSSNTALSILDLSGNQLSGSIPSFAGNTALWRLDLNGNQMTGPVHQSLGTLTNLSDWSGLDLRWNALFSTDAVLITFLNSKQDGGDWQSTQTIPVTGLSADGVLPTQVTVNWTPIVYTADSGNYQAFYSTTSGGPYTPFATATANKSASSLTVTGLTSLTPYFFVVQTTTSPHANNQNTALSGFSAEVSSATATTLATALFAVPPCRLFDTRNSGTSDAAAPILAAGEVRTLVLNGRCGIPASARALSVNVTVTQPEASGTFVLYRGDLGSVPEASTISFPAGRTRANNSILALDLHGGQTIRVLNDSTGPAHFILDVSGYFE